MNIAKSHYSRILQHRWSFAGLEWQQGMPVQPRTVIPEHMKENLNYFDFVVSNRMRFQV